MTTPQSSFFDEVRSFLTNLWPVFTVLFLVATFYYQDFLSMANIWSANETYAHGYIIFPISVWLLWEHRFEIALATAKTDYRFYPFLLMNIVVWMLAEFLGIQALSQLSVLSMAILAVWMITGFQMGKLIFFPMIFLLFMAPIGDFLVPPMMEFTATFTVNLIRLTGIPVFREGMFFTLPTGNWSVVEACSGVRYIIASLTLGVLFAFLNYRSVKKQVIFIIVSFLVPILANGLRAYMIVMIGHLSGMELATGVDHLIYGWVFFGVVMLILFAIGAIWRDDMAPPVESKKTTHVCFVDKRSTWIGIAVLSVTLLLPVLYVNGQKVTIEPTGLPYVGGYSTDHWHLCDQPEVTGWKPGIGGETAKSEQQYCQDDDTVSLFVAYYAHQQQGHEAVSYANTLTLKEGDDWTASKVQSKQLLAINFEASQFDVEASIVVRKGQAYRVWRWYRIGQHLTADEITAKLYEAYAKLFENRSDALMLVIATPITQTLKVEEADQILQQFTENIFPFIIQHTDQLIGKPSS